MKMEHTHKSPKFFTKLGILIGFSIEVLAVIFMQMSEADLQYWIGKKELIRKQLPEMFNQTGLYTVEREVWRKFYQKYFSIDLNVSDIRIPDAPADGDWRLIVVAHGLTLNQVYDRMSEAFKCLKYVDDLDANVIKNTRTASETYAVWVHVGVEPDENHLGKSTNEADPDMKIGITFLERMLLEIVYFDETGKHLDLVGWTLCTGSRSVDGYVPYVRYHALRVLVYRYHPADSYALRGLREAVSHSPE